MGVGSSDLQSKFRWLQSTVVNETDFRLTFDDTNYRFRKGRFWAAPGNVAANGESTYSICNKLFGFGVNGVVRYRLTVNPETTLTIVINYRNEFFGDMLVTANIERDGTTSKETNVLVDGVETKISVRCAPGNEAKITVFYNKETATPKTTEAATVQ